MKKSVRMNAILNAIKQLCQVIFSVVTIPYVTRILKPANYGVVNFSSSVISYFTLIAGLGISTYAIREGAKVREIKGRFEKLASEVYSINIISTLIAFAMLSVVLLFPFFRQYRLIMLIQSMTFIFTTLGADWVNSVYEDYLYITLRYISFQVLALILLFIFVKDENDYIIYVLILTTSTVGANICNIFYIRKKYVKLRFLITKNTFNHLLPVFVLFGNAVATTIYVNSDVTMIGAYRSETEVGLYSLASKIYTVVKLVLSGVLQVTVPRISMAIGKNKNIKFINSQCKKIMDVLLLLLIPIVTILFFFKKQIILMLGGSEYLEGEKCLGILALAIFFSMIAFFNVNCILIPFNLEKDVLKLSLVGAVMNVGMNFFAIPKMGYVGAAYTTLSSEILVAIMSFYCANKKVGYKYCMGFKEFILHFVSILFVLVTCYIVQSIIDNVFVGMILGATMAMFVYCVFLIIIRNEIAIEQVNNIENILRRKK